MKDIIKANEKKTGQIKPPKFPLEEIEDFYTYYVLILRIPETCFWSSDLLFLDRVARNKTAFDGWQSYALREEAKRSGK